MQIRLGDTSVGFVMQQLIYLLQAHIAIAECEKRLKSQGRRVFVITQNIDELHKRAGTENILELHGIYMTHL